MILKKETSHMNVPLGWAVLNCGAAKSLAGAEPAAMLDQACEKLGCKAGDDCMVEAVEEKHHFCGIGEQVITPLSSCKCLELSDNKMCITHQI